MLCWKLGVTRGGYYAWLERKESQRTLSNEALLVEIKRVHAASDERYGYPRVHAALKREGIACGRNRVARIMRENGIVGKKAKRFKYYRHKHHIYNESKNLLLNREPVIFDQPGLGRRYNVYTRRSSVGILECCHGFIQPKNYRLDIRERTQSRLGQ